MASLMADYWELGKESWTAALRVIDWAAKMASLKAEPMELRTAAQKVGRQAAQSADKSVQQQAAETES